MKTTLPISMLLCPVMVASAHANQVAANRCAASLQPEARLVFNAVNQTPQQRDWLRTVIEARVRELIFMDRLTIGAARPAAEAASECLRIERNCYGDTCRF